jgi:hypothetical protein
MSAPPDWRSIAAMNTGASQTAFQSRRWRSAHSDGVSIAAVYEWASQTAFRYSQRGSAFPNRLSAAPAYECAFDWLPIMAEVVCGSLSRADVLFFGSDITRRRGRAWHPPNGLRVSRAAPLDGTGSWHKPSLQNRYDLGAAKRRRLHARVGPQVSLLISMDIVPAFTEGASEVP